MDDNMSDTINTKTHMWVHVNSIDKVSCFIVK